MASKNYLQLEIDGQKYGLKFNIGTFKILGENLGVDPFTYKTASKEFSDVVNWVKPILKAALLSNHLTKKETVEYTDQQIDDLVNELSVADLTLIGNMWSNPSDSKPSVNGEVTQNTQSGTDLG
ncbi:hypothetical protein [Paraflavitalea pollutisoli]|uniref:hypothetical protein n=1 Tax=Paraflavitalea pollutisoli TaxID=3034143 RepID=UPI0023ED9288|nr:hypothetical protein [Paraflavitalea sp. H1-2-19X]